MKQTYYWLLGIAVLAVLAGLAVQFKPARLGLDIQGGTRIIVRAKTETLTPEQRQEWSQKQAKIANDILPSRVSNGLGVQEAPIHTKGSDQFVVELPGYTNVDEAKSIIGTTAQLKFVWLKQVQTDLDTNRRYKLDVTRDDRGKEVVRFTDSQAADPKLSLIKPEGETKKKYLELLSDPEFAQVIVTGDDLTRAQAQPGQQGTVVQLEFKGDKFGDFVVDSTHYKEIIGIVLDDTVISAPRNNLQERVNNPTIEGTFTIEEASKLAALLNAGALPVELEVLQVTKIEPTLGRQALHMISIAGLVSAGLIVLGMVAYYLLPGVLATVALLLYSLYCYAMFKVMGVTFSLAGIAGFILSIGMAVDANILIFERMKEELRTGKTLMASIDAGFKRAFTAIFDSNACTLITCGVLFSFGSDVVKGFATTLGVGVLISLFTAITCTRTFLYLLVGKGVAQNPRMFGLKRQIAGESKFDFVGRRNVWFVLSLLFITPGAIFWMLGGIKPNIEFKGGTEVTYVLEQPITGSSEQVMSTLTARKVDVDNVQIADGGRQLIVRAKQFGGDAQSKLSAAIEESRIAHLSRANGSKIEPSVEAIGGSIRAEMVQNAIISVVLSIALITLYIAIRFAIEGGWSGFKFGTAAIIATAHDVLVVVGMAAVFGYLLNWEISALFLTAVLTIIGFSVHDTIVIFDRIRENLRLRARGETYDSLVNRSISQSFARSILTSVTVALTVTVLLLIGSATPDLKHFHAAMLVGIISGAYSSIFNAAQVLVVWEHMQGKRQAAAPAEEKPMVSGPAPRSMPAAPRAATRQQTEPSPNGEETTGVDERERASKAPKRKRRM